MYSLLKDKEKFKVELIRGHRPSDWLCYVSDYIKIEDHKFVVGELKDENGEQRWVAVIDESAKRKYEKKKKKNDLDNLKYKEYAESIDSEMGYLFKTKNRHKASSIYLTWLLMRDYPQEFIDKGLKDGKGNSLDSESKVYNYAEKNILKAIDYSVFLIKQERKYKGE